MYLLSNETGGFLPPQTASLKECLTQYLNIHSTLVNFLRIKQTLMNENPNSMSDHPMSAPLLKVLALEVSYLLDLCQAMLDDMLTDFPML